MAVALPENAASLRVMEKLGMTPQGVRECYGGELREYVLTAAEWRRRGEPRAGAAGPAAS